MFIISLWYFIFKTNYKQLKIDKMKTYDIFFNDDNNANNLGFKQTLEFCLNFIHLHNGSNESYFLDYLGGKVSILCNETCVCEYEEVIF